MSEEKTLMDFVKQAKSQIHEIEVLNVKSLLDEGYQILDVREPAEFMSGTIEGALNIPRGILEAAADRQYAGRREELMDRDKKWLLLCASSGRSAMAAAVMQQMGFKHIRNINGGIAAWKAAELAVNIPPQT
ncbi:rhodanese-like domain-containing protein [Methylotuvimicrobium alcaliphilum]|uniref:Rhodanese domain protein n=1 Tax=Methylotuvimicrobium alcaliphilum (strain DSM 19304 / NCIMB 14124 / VKM B-2133 / 20Z) TaxID=1091494 RepID=G4SXJ7_META2|nr:rhodanese-like domain-containing protein [Methylotuvimicrobium alcaliphilum]CCE22052.1 Rhodanese domain protein [Methylotuvimicrobium alcaliphilum 20Z]